MTSRPNNIDNCFSDPVDIVLAYPLAQPRFHLAPQIGLAYIASRLQTEGYNPLHLADDRKGFRLTLDYLTRLAKSGTYLFGFTTYSHNYLLVRALAHSLKKRAPDALILLGGPLASAKAPDILEENPAVEFVCLGEGEELTVELLHHLKANEPLEGIPGLVVRSNMYSFSRRPPIKDLDCLPPPVPISGMTVTQALKMGVSTARGCPFRCTYCNFSYLSPGEIRYHSIPYVIEVIKWLSERVKEMDCGSSPMTFLNDETLTYNIGRSKRLFSEIAKVRGKLQFWCETRADRITHDLLDLMSQAGVIAINFGLESAVPRILRNIRKVKGSKSESFLEERRFLDTVQRAVSWAKEIGIRTEVSYISGLPGETIEDATATVDFARELKADLYHHSALYIFPGTELYKDVPEDYLLEPMGNVIHSMSRYPIDLAKVSTLPGEISDTDLELLESLNNHSRRNVYDEVFFDGSISFELALAFLQKHCDVDTFIYIFAPEQAWISSLEEALRDPKSLLLPYKLTILKRRKGVKISIEPRPFSIRPGIANYAELDLSTFLGCKISDLDEVDLALVTLSSRVERTALARLARDLSKQTVIALPTAILSEKWRMFIPHAKPTKSSERKSIFLNPKGDIIWLLSRPIPGMNAESHLAKIRGLFETIRLARRHLPPLCLRSLTYQDRFFLIRLDKMARQAPIRYLGDLGKNRNILRCDVFLLNLEEAIMLILPETLHTLLCRPLDIEIIEAALNLPSWDDVAKYLASRYNNPWPQIIELVENFKQRIKWNENRESQPN